MAKNERRTDHEERDLLRIIVHGASAFELLRTGLEFDLFDKLEEAGGMDLPTVASSLGIQEQPARILLQGLAALTLIKKEGAKYVNAHISREKLLKKGPKFVGPLIDIQAKIINPCMLDFAESLRQFTNVGLRHISGPGDTLYRRVTAHPELQKVFYDNMGDGSRKASPFALEAYDFSGLKHVLDLGGGDGSNSIMLAKRFPHMHATVFDEATVAPIVKQNAEKAGVADRVHHAAGDFFKDPYPKGIDGIFIFHIFEIWSLERNTELLRRAYEALPPGGAVAVYNFVSNDENTGPLTPAFMSAYFIACASGEGMCYSGQDMADCVAKAGFKDIKRFDDLPFHHSLVVAYK